MQTNGNGKSVVFDGDSHRPASFLRDQLGKESPRDPAYEIPGMPPNFGKLPVPHVATYAGFFGTYSKVYRANDEALKDSLQNARFMRNDPGIMECLEARQRATALLDWHIEPEDDEKPEQQELAMQVERIIRRIRRFTEYRRSLLEAIWYGRAAIQHRVGSALVHGRMRFLPKPSKKEEHPGWLPIHGDKIVFRYDDGYMTPNEGTVGILTGSRFGSGEVIRNMWKVEPTQRGLAAFIPPQIRDIIVIHKHMLEDGAWEAPQDAGGIHGVGCRSRVYWDWFQKQECLAFLIEYLERSAGGIEVWSYPAGDSEGLERIKEAAKERIANGRNMLFFPKPLGEDAPYFDVQVIEPGMGGIDQLHRLLTEYFGHRIKRYILGQILTTEAEATGLGSGLAEMHMDSFLQIVRYDATNLEETLTHELVEPIQRWNFPGSRGIQLRFVIETEQRDVKDRLEALKMGWEMGAAIPAADVLDTLGIGEVQPGEDVLQNETAGKHPPQPEGMFGGFGPGQPGEGGAGRPGGEPGEGGADDGPAPGNDVPPGLPKPGGDGASLLPREPEPADDPAQYAADGPHDTGDRHNEPDGPEVAHDPTDRRTKAFSIETD